MDIEPFRIYLSRLQVKRKRLSTSTIEQTIQRIEFLHAQCSPLSYEKISAFIHQKLQAGTKESSINKYIQSIKHWGRFQHLDWVEHFTQYEEQYKPPTCLSDEEIQRFLSVERRSLQTEENYQKWQLYWHIALFSGLRHKEIRTLRVDQVDLANKVFILEKTKTTPRLAAFMSFIYSALEKRMKEISGVYLFPSPHNPKIPMTNRAYVNDFEYRIKTLGIQRKLVPNDTRHTAVTRWIRELKMNIFDVKHQAGHSNLSTTEKYYAFAGIYSIQKQLEDDPITQEKSSRYLIKKIGSFIDSLGLHDKNDIDYVKISEAKRLLWEAVKG